MTNIGGSVSLVLPGSSLSAALAAQGDAGGGTVQLGPGVFSDVSVTVPANVVLRGSGIGATVLEAASGQATPVVTLGAAYAGVESLSVQYPGVTQSSTSTPSTGAGIAFTTDLTGGTSPVNFCEIRDVEVIGFNVGLQSLGAPGNKVSTIEFARIYNVSLFSCNLSAFLVGLADSIIEDVTILNCFGGSPSGVQTTLPNAEGSALVDVETFTDAQWFCQDLGNSVVNKIEIYGGVGSGIVFQESVNTRISSCEVGETSGHGVMLVGQQGGLVDNGNFGGNALDGIYVTSMSDGSASLDLRIYDTVTGGNGHNGIEVDTTSGPPAAHVTVVNARSEGNSTASSGTYDGLRFHGSGLRVVGGRFVGGGASGQNFGINFNTSGTSDVSLIGVDFSGGNSNNNTYSGITTGSILGCNFSAYYENMRWGYYNPGLPGGTGSGYAIQNGGPGDVFVYQTGGAGIHIKDVFGNDVALPGGSQEMVKLKTGDEIYFETTTPTSWRWYGDGG